MGLGDPEERFTHMTGEAHTWSGALGVSSRDVYGRALAVQSTSGGRRRGSAVEQLSGIREVLGSILAPKKNKK